YRHTVFVDVVRALGQRQYDPEVRDLILGPPRRTRPRGRQDIDLRLITRELPNRTCARASPYEARIYAAVQLDAHRIPPIRIVIGWHIQRIVEDLPVFAPLPLHHAGWHLFRVP